MAESTRRDSKRVLLLINAVAIVCSALFLWFPGQTGFSLGDRAPLTIDGQPVEGLFVAYPAGRWAVVTLPASEENRREESATLIDWDHVRSESLTDLTEAIVARLVVPAPVTFAVGGEDAIYLQHASEGLVRSVSRVDPEGNVTRPTLSAGVFFIAADGTPVTAEHLGADGDVNLGEDAVLLAVGGALAALQHDPDSPLVFVSIANGGWLGTSGRSPFEAIGYSGGALGVAIKSANNRSLEWWSWHCPAPGADCAMAERQLLATTGDQEIITAAASSPSGAVRVVCRTPQTTSEHYEVVVWQIRGRRAVHRGVRTFEGRCYGLELHDDGRLLIHERDGWQQRTLTFSTQGLFAL